MYSSSSRTFTVTKFLLTKIGGLYPQYRRPLQTFLDRGIQDHVLDVVKGRSKITPAGLAFITDHFLSVNARAESNPLTPEDQSPLEVEIPHGWAADRYLFELVIESVDPTGLMTLVQHVLGYTDHATPLADDTFDPTTKFYINSIHSQSKFLRHESLGLVPDWRMLDSSQLLRNFAFENMGAEQQLYTLCPSSILDTIETQQMFPMEETFVVDARVRVTANAQRSKRSHASPAHYLSELLDTYMNCLTYDAENANESTAAIVRSGSIQEDPFLDALRRQPSAVTGEFVLADLRVLTADNVHPEIDLMDGKLPTFLETEKWDTSSMNVRWATAITQALPAFMVDHDLRTFCFSASNMDAVASEGKPVWFQPFNVSRFGDQPVDGKLIEAVAFQIEHVLLKGLSQGNRIGFNMIVTCDLADSTRVELVLNDSKETVFVSPTFADGLFSPLLTRDKGLLDANAHDVTQLLDRLAEQFEQDHDGNRPVHD